MHIEQLYNNGALQKLLVFTQPVSTCSKSTIGTLKQGMKTFKANNKYTRTASITSFWCLYC